MSPSPEQSAPTPWGRVIAVGLALTIAVGTLLLAFSWPALTASPHNVTIGIVGDDASAEQVQAAVVAESDGVVEPVRYEDRDAAVEAVRAREADGAVILPAQPGQAPEVLKASAAGAPLAAMLDGLAVTLQAQVDGQIRAQIEAMSAQAPGPVQIPTVTVEVTDLAPFTDGDPRGMGLGVAMFPLVLGGTFGGVLIALTVRGAVQRVVGVVIYAAAAGAVLAGILQGWLGVLQGNGWLNAAAIALAVAAIASTVAAFAALWGKAGAAVAAALFVLFANPLSAAAVPANFLLAPWGAIGQALPPGAAASLLRNLSYFPDANVSGSWWLLVIWACVGLALSAVTLTSRRTESVA